VGRIVFVLNQAQSQSGNPTARPEQLGQGRQRLAIIRQAARPLGCSAPLRRRQLYQSASFQPAQRHAGRADSQFSVRLAPANGPTEFLNQLAAGRRRRSLGTPAQPFQHLTIYPSSTDSNRAQHPLTMHAHMLAEIEPSLALAWVYRNQAARAPEFWQKDAEAASHALELRPNDALAQTLRDQACQHLPAAPAR
jgi:hypothetical protein